MKLRKWSRGMFEFFLWKMLLRRLQNCHIGTGIINFLQCSTHIVEQNQNIILKKNIIQTNKTKQKQKIQKTAESRLKTQKNFFKDKI